MADRFGLVFEILDRAYVARMRRERGFGVNPWRTHSRFLVSHRLLIDPAYADPLRAWLGPALPGSLLILDEAHHAAPASGGRYGVETKLTRAVRDLGGRFEHRLFLSATPHNGHSNSFSTLLELLDSARFTRGVKVTGRQALDAVMVRRLKEDVRRAQGGFPQRKVVRIVIENLPEDAPELRLSRLLDDYRSVREQRLASGSARAQAAAGLLLVGLQQRLLSSVEAFARNLAVHRRAVERHWEQASGPAAPAAETARATGVDPRFFTSAPGADDERASWTADDVETDERQQVEAVTAAAEGERDPGADAGLRLRERALLDRMQAPPRWNERRVLIFTENREGTKRYLRERNGRIDRKLQPAAEVRCHYFVLPQREEDRVLDVLVRKTETIRRELGSLSKVIDDDVERRLGAGIRCRDAGKLAREIERADPDARRRNVAEEELESARARQADLQAQIDRCRTLLDRSRRWVGFEPEPFRDALSCSLELLGAPPLSVTRTAQGAEVWTFPPLDPPCGRRPELDRHARFAARAAAARPDTGAVAAGGPHPPRGVRGRGPADRRDGAPAPGAAHRAAPAGPLPVAGLHPP